MKYKIYRNLNNKKLSIKDHKSGLVVGHCDEVNVFLADFKVSKKGVERIRSEKRKHVVATVNGGISWMKGFVPHKGRDVSLCYPHVPGGSQVAIAFDPYKYESFVEREWESPVEKAELVVIDKTGFMRAWGAQ